MAFARGNRGPGGTAIPSRKLRWNRAGSRFRVRDGDPPPASHSRKKKKKKNSRNGTTGSQAASGPRGRASAIPPGISASITSPGSSPGVEVDWVSPGPGRVVNHDVVPVRQVAERPQAAAGPFDRLAVQAPLPGPSPRCGQADPTESVSTGPERSGYNGPARGPCSTQVMGRKRPDGGGTAPSPLYRSAIVTVFPPSSPLRPARSAIFPGPGSGYLALNHCLIKWARRGHRLPRAPSAPPHHLHPGYGSAVKVSHRR